MSDSPKTINASLSLVKDIGSLLGFEPTFLPTSERSVVKAEYLFDHADDKSFGVGLTGSWGTQYSSNSIDSPFQIDTASFGVSWGSLSTPIFKDRTPANFGTLTGSTRTAEWQQSTITSTHPEHEGDAQTFHGITLGTQSTASIGVFLGDNSEHALTAGLSLISRNTWHGMDDSKRESFNVGPTTFEVGAHFTYTYDASAPDTARDPRKMSRTEKVMAGFGSVHAFGMDMIQLTGLTRLAGQASGLLETINPDDDSAIDSPEINDTAIFPAAQRIMTSTEILSTYSRLKDDTLFKILLASLETAKVVAGAVDGGSAEPGDADSLTIAMTASWRLYAMGLLEFGNLNPETRYWVSKLVDLGIFALAGAVSNDQVQEALVNTHSVAHMSLLAMPSLTAIDELIPGRSAYQYSPWGISAHRDEDTVSRGHLAIRKYLDTSYVSSELTMTLDAKQLSADSLVARIAGDPSPDTNTPITMTFGWGMNHAWHLGAGAYFRGALGGHTAIWLRGVSGDAGVGAYAQAGFEFELPYFDDARIEVGARGAYTKVLTNGDELNFNPYIGFNAAY